MNTPMVLKPRGHYRLDLACAYLAGSPSTILERLGQGSVARAVRLLGTPVLITLRSDGSRPSAITVHVAGHAIDDRLRDAATRWVIRTFHLEIDEAPFFDMAAAKPAFAQMIAPYRGLRPVLIASPYESLMWAVCGQQVHVRLAYRLKRGLVDLCGSSWTFDGQDYRLMPEPDAVAATAHADLRRLGFSGRKAAYLTELSAAVAGGDLDLEGLRRVSSAEALATLTGFRGIGRWTAEYVLMRGLGHPDVFPAADMGLRRILGRINGDDVAVTEAQARASAAHWAGWKSWFAFYCWALLQKSQTGIAWP
ncbi:MAG TPA: hypothetical protein VFN52_02690 [Acidiferrobacteraceae bacterium]|nr:hypothetical protein [Acidiferrobacteraceae bacterium]